jgi:hypothetical protein
LGTNQGRIEPSYPIPEVLMLVVVLLAVFVLVVTAVVATIAAVRRDGHGAIPESVAYDTRRPLP